MGAGGEPGPHSRRHLAVHGGARAGRRLGGGVFGSESNTAASTPLGPPGLLHWDGNAWHQVPLARTTCGLAGIASDGAGGIWVLPCLGDWRGAQYLHWRTGRWTDVYAKPLGPVLSEDAEAIALVPGTQQVWSADFGQGGPTLNLYTPS